MHVHYSKIFTVICQSALTIVTGSCLTTALPAVANPQLIADNSTPTIEFYCGKAKDLTSQSILPATVVKVSGSEEEPVFIIWKSEAFGKFTPQQRCETVSPKVQAAIQQGRNFVRAGIDKQNGYGIICAVANEEQACDRSTMLFTLKSYQNAETTIAGIVNFLNGNSVGPEIQSAGNVIDLRKFASLKRK